jgi:phosphoglycerate dehydrogenase-like enzyme
MKLVHYLQWEGPALTALAPRFEGVQFVTASSTADAVKELADADAFVVAGPYYAGEVAAAVNATAPKLRWIQSSSIGTDKFEKGGVPAGITLTNAAGLKGRTVAEHAMALMLGFVHALPQMERYRSAAHWARDDLRSEISSLEGQTLLVLGYGSIGKEIARKAKAFDMHVVALNSSGEGDGAADIVASIAGLDRWLPEADFVACALPATPGTDGLIGADRLAAMKPGAILLNVGRGSTVDHGALVDALRSRSIAGACLDVFGEEPLPAGDALWQLPNLILSPHVAGTGGPAGLRFAELFSENLTRFLEGRDLKNVVEIGRS